MRVLHLVTNFGIGGAERVALDLVRHQREDGDVVGLAAAPGFLDGELPAGIARYHVADRGRSPIGVLAATRAVAGVLRRFRPDVVHTHGIRVLAMALGARALVAGRGGPPILATHQATAPRDLRLTTSLLRRADRVACVSAALRERVVAAGVPPDRAAVVRNAVEPAPPLPDAKAAEIDRELDLEGRPVVSLVGRLEEQKVPGRFVDVAAAVAARDDRVRFLVVGDGSLREATEARARAHGIEHAIRFTGTRQDARALIGRSQVLVFTSTWEGLSVAALEALAAGVPVVATNTDGMSELLRDGVGVIVDDPSLEAWRDVILGLIDDEPRRDEIARRARRLIDTEFSARAMADAYRAQYARLVR